MPLIVTNKYIFIFSNPKVNKISQIQATVFFLTAKTTCCSSGMTVTAPNGAMAFEISNPPCPAIRRASGRAN